MTKIDNRETVELEKIHKLTQELERLERLEHLEHLKSLERQLAVSDEVVAECDQIMKLRVDTALVMRRVLFLTQNPSIEASIENTLKLKRFIEENWEPIEFCGREYAP